MAPSLVIKRGPGFFPTKAPGNGVFGGPKTGGPATRHPGPPANPTLPSARALVQAMGFGNFKIEHQFVKICNGHGGFL